MSDNVAKVLAEVDEMLNSFVDSLKFVTELEDGIGATDISVPAAGEQTTPIGAGSAWESGDDAIVDVDGNGMGDVKVSGGASMLETPEGRTDLATIAAGGADRESGVYGIDPVSGDVLKVSAPDGMYKSGQFMNTVEGLAGVALNKGQIESRLEKKVAQAMGLG